MDRRWTFGDQLGPHFLDGDDQPVLMIESRRVFARRRFHRQKAHLVLSAMRHRAAELGDQVRYLRAETYREALAQVSEPLTVCRPTSYAADRFVRRLPQVEVLPARGFVTSQAEFAEWAGRRGAKRLLMEDFYREARVRLGVLMEGNQPAGGRWNFDQDNREAPPRRPTLGTPEPWWPREDEIDAEVRDDLDRWQRSGDVQFVGVDGPRRFAVTRQEALHALSDFVAHRLPAFGPHEDAMLAGDDWMAHSLLSATLNLGLLDPMEAVEQAEDAYRAGAAPLASVEGFVRQLIGWRDYMWHLYWHFGPDYRRSNQLAARQPVPEWFTELDADGTVGARCLSEVLRGVREHGWVHHIPRLMVLGNYALQRGWCPDEVTDWFHRSFVDGYDWVMVANVVGMSLHADGGRLATKPYAAGGAYIDKMSDFCGGCRYNPKVRVGPDACPFTAGYWWFLDRNADRLAGNQRIARALAGRHRLSDLPELILQEQDRGSEAP
ncbi:deoxyribodipyrimidine photolyase-related protein [Kribbella flavida DSM 17836]|uniref:Deoxyribodipyrimidine photolyase-related protein n=1 Tax=Kribbella flavida (strain DSM 17836 / JCM 10339 / NBRC 14399) TaxID=479435 RepID=D2PR70_KRIFD|nr:cryptochrome/photolyase family protein [Kribbella flavida]ADB33018.1 deoxyribodipyrimidine photolyase-related protein [Kribbella flavida DSM 17836]